MPPVPSLPFPEAIYNQLPAKERKKLARATGKQSAFASASLLSNTLKNPAVVKALPKDSFGSYINKSGQIKWWPRLKLTLRHFFHALFSNYAKLSKDFAKLVERLSKANPKGGSATRKEAISAGSVGGQGTGVKNFAANLVASGLGSAAGHALSDRREHKKTKSAGGDGGDAAVDKTGHPEDADKLRSKGREDQDEDVRSDSGEDASEVDDDAHSDAGSDHDDDDGADNDGGDSDGGWFSWLSGGDGDGGDGGGGD